MLLTGKAVSKELRYDNLSVSEKELMELHRANGPPMPADHRAAIRALSNKRKRSADDDGVCVCLCRVKACFEYHLKQVRATFPIGGGRRSGFLGESPLSQAPSEPFSDDI